MTHKVISIEMSSVKESYEQVNRLEQEINNMEKEDWELIETTGCGTPSKRDGLLLIFKK